MNKIVIFDWGGVIENHNDPEYGWYALTRNIIRRLANDNSREIQAWGSYLNDDNKMVNICSVGNSIEFNKWIDYIANENGFDNDKEKFFNVYHEEYSKIYYYKDVVDYMHSLKGRCLVGILSNLVMVDKERLNKQVDFNYIDKLFLSFELGLVKPNDDIYAKVEELSGIDPSNILFIDDREDNVMGAKNRGWNVLRATGEDLELIKKTIEDFIR